MCVHACACACARAYETVNGIDLEGKSEVHEGERGQIAAPRLGQGSGVRGHAQVHRMSVS